MPLYMIDERNAHDMYYNLQNINADTSSIDISLNVLSFKFNTFSKCVLVHFQLSSTAPPFLAWIRCSYIIGVPFSSLIYRPEKG
jgi:hypothetical protein